jgi:hypothetical protein
MTDQMHKVQTHTMFMLVRTTTTWLALPPPARFAFLGEVIVPILKANPTVAMRFFDAEAYSARVSDVIVWITNDLAAYQRVVEALRETAFWGGYFDVVDILPSIENAYASHYGVAPIGG